MKKTARFLFLFLLGSLSCSCNASSPSSLPLKVTAVENFLADIAQNVAGDRFAVNSLIPYGIEPHEFEPTPKDMAAVAESDLLIANGGGLEGWLETGLKNVGGSRILVTASAGLTSRPVNSAPVPSNSSGSSPAPSSSAVDPHFWFDPVLVKTYVANILQGFLQLDPSGEADYRRNARSYIAALDDLDGWIRSQVDLIPAEQRVLVTDHEDLGYFADQYGFEILGSLYPGISPDAEPSASQFADLIQKIRSSRAKAIFLEMGANTQLANQLSQETGIRVIAGLYTHSLTPPGGVAPTYLDMIRYDVNLIVEALK